MGFPCRPIIHRGMNEMPIAILDLESIEGRLRKRWVDHDLSGGSSIAPHAPRLRASAPPVDVFGLDAICARKISSPQRRRDAEKNQHKRQNRRAQRRQREALADAPAVDWTSGSLIFAFLFSLRLCVSAVDCLWALCDKGGYGTKPIFHRRDAETQREALADAPAVD